MLILVRASQENQRGGASRRIRTSATNRGKFNPAARLKGELDHEFCSQSMWLIAVSTLGSAIGSTKRFTNWNIWN